jgi:hypothetical protein
MSPTQAKCIGGSSIDPTSWKENSANIGYREF